MKFLTSFTFVELVIALTVLWCLVMSGILENGSGIVVAWDRFLPNYLLALMLIIVGVWYRVYRNIERVAVVFICTGLFVAFTNVGAKINYLLYPTGVIGADMFLKELDFFIGFDWITYVSWFEGRAFLSSILRLLYQSSLLQLLIVIIFLGFSGYNHRLADFFLVGVLSSILSIVIWSIWPSFGPARVLTLPLSVQHSLQLVVDESYIAHMNSLIDSSIGHVEPSSMRGLIAFPSMHSVMGLMTIYFVFGTRIFPLFLLLNIPMPFAILLHGGHHLVDLFGGAALFFFAVWIVKRLNAFRERF